MFVFVICTKTVARSVVKSPFIFEFQMYNFTSFAMALNELDKEMESVIPKTDCRLRPDIRAMENGEIGNSSYGQLFFLKTEGLGKKLLNQQLGEVISHALLHDARQ